MTRWFHFLAHQKGFTQIFRLPASWQQKDLKLHIFLIFNWSLASLCTRTRHSIGREPMPQLLFTGANSRVNTRAASLIVKMSMIPHKSFSHRYCLAYFTSTVHTSFTGTAENQLSTWFQVMIRSFSCLRIARANSGYLWVLTAWMVFIHPFQRQDFMHLISNPQPYWRTWNLRTFLSAWRRKRRFHEHGRAPPCPGSSRIQEHPTTTGDTHHDDKENRWQ